jgi:flagellar hook-basal body complex protein FliE
MSISPISGATSGMDVSKLFAAYQQQITAGTGTDPSTAASQAAASTRGTNFGDMISGGLQQVENLDDTAAAKAVQAATGDLSNVQDYVIAADKAQVATELTTTLRDKALDAFNEIMRMSL